MKRADSAGIILNKIVDDLSRAVLGAVVDGNDQHLVGGITHCHQRSQDIRDHLLFVVSGHQDGYWRPVGRVDIDVGMALKSEQPIQREPIVARSIYAR